ncbi:MAG: hypothetical protein MK052_10100 [Alphaproteobacteria bacterium]|nr:hypothetical protein [Alphaproteobacteria bacterium]
MIGVALVTGLLALFFIGASLWILNCQRKAKDTTGYFMLMFITIGAAASFANFARMALATCA